MYKYAVNSMSVPEIIERSQEDKSTVKYRTFVLLPPRSIIKFFRLRSGFEPGGGQRYGILPYFCPPGSVL